jgi:hypothetical protein
MFASRRASRHGPRLHPICSHALIALAYCTGLVTDDKSLFENSRVTLKTFNLLTRLSRRVTKLRVEVG